MRDIQDEIDATEGLVIHLTPPKPPPPAPQVAIAKVPPPVSTPAKVMPKAKTPSPKPALPPLPQNVLDELARGGWIESNLWGEVRGKRRYCGPNYTYCQQKGRAQGMHPYECFSCGKDLRKGEAKSGPTPIQPWPLPKLPSAGASIAKSPPPGAPIAKLSPPGAPSGKSPPPGAPAGVVLGDRKSTRLNSSHT